MIDKLLSYIAPHYCSGCAIEGTLLCNNCKYDIISESFSTCAACGRTCVTNSGVCGNCKVPYRQIWFVADRRDQLEILLNNYKFKNMRAAYRPLADMLDARLPQLPDNTVIVPVPTISSHIRQRGYDHMLLIANQLGRIRNHPVLTNLQRTTSTKQVGAGRRQRLDQAKVAFICRETLDSSLTYLLVDDVITTGATVEYATRALQDAGATDVRVASISRQTLD